MFLSVFHPWLRFFGHELSDANSSSVTTPQGDAPAELRVFTGTRQTKRLRESVALPVSLIALLEPRITLGRGAGLDC